MTAFYVIGGLLAVWAVILAATGIARDRFPGGRGEERAVIGISAVLVVAAIGSAVIGGALEEEEEPEAAAAAEAAPGETTAPPSESVAEEAPGGEELALSAEPGGDFAFEEEELEAPAGPITLAMENPSPIPHNVSLDGEGVNEVGETVETDGTSTVSADLAPGEYLYYCSVPGHREGGMEGTLTVE